MVQQPPPHCSQNTLTLFLVMRVVEEDKGGAGRCGGDAFGAAGSPGG